MVGHSGKMEPTVRAVEAVDAGLGQIYAALQSSGGAWIITADHGNAETMIDPVTKGPHTYHTTNPVPFILVDDDRASCCAPAARCRTSRPPCWDSGRKTAQGNDGERFTFMKSSVVLILFAVSMMAQPKRAAIWACLSTERLAL